MREERREKEKNKDIFQKYQHIPFLQAEPNDLPAV